MESMNYLTVFNELPIEVTLQKINKNFFGKDTVELTTMDKLYDYLVSPMNALLMQIESNDLENMNLNNGEVVIVERSHLKIDGPAVVRINGELKVVEINHDKEFKTIIKFGEDYLFEDIDFSFFGTITYAIKSKEEYFLEMIGEELFKIN